MRIGPFEGDLGPGYDDAELAEALALLPDRLQAEGKVLSEARHQMTLCPLPVHGTLVDCVVKRYGRQRFLKDRMDARHGTKARRSFTTACHLQEHGVGTPAPVACLERWKERRLAESYFVTRFEPDLTDFRKALIHLYRFEPHCATLMDLLQRVADAVRGMHDSGVLHRDLGNQNILLQDDVEQGVLFVDLNRAQLRQDMSLRERARDISRLFLASDLLRIFCQMYWQGPVPREFGHWERRYRSRYARHDRTRAWRHPIREHALRGTTPDDETYPDLRDIWIWDDRSAQPIQVARGPERRRAMPAANAWHQAVSAIRHAGPVWRTYRALEKTAYASPVTMSNRIGVSVDPTAEPWPARRKALSDLGSLPVLVRIYHHQGETGQATAVAAVQELQQAGHPVTVSLVQDRRAVLDPASWRAFGDRVLDQVATHVEAVEVGHAINRVKWGLWDLRALDDFYAPLEAWRARHPSLTLLGPACIDFEYPFVLAALDRVPGAARFDHLSHHLYVDRRGAPENRQGPFSLLEKAALLRAIARVHGRTGEQVICSEVNWPLADTGVYSPVGSPYNYPGEVVGFPSVSESEYAGYMIRYLLIAICSGFVDRVFWWRLAAHGFGLMSDLEGLHPRPAYAALGQFVKRVGDATFLRYDEWGRGWRAFVFERSAGDRVTVAYTTNPSEDAAVQRQGCKAQDLVGNALDGEVDVWAPCDAPFYIEGPWEFGRAG